MTSTVVECSRCKKEYHQRKVYTTCPECGGALLFRYDLKAISKIIARNDLKARHGTFWKFFEFLPLSSRESIVTLNEPYTPILKLQGSSVVNLENVYVKDDGRLPTGTFKARGIAVAVSCLKELGIKSTAIPSAGNAAVASAYYGSKAEIEVNIFLPKDVPDSILEKCVAMNAKTYLVDGLIDDAAGIVNRFREKYNWFDLSTNKQPYRFEGYKAMAFEVAEQFSWNPPDYILFPTGGGEGLIGLWKGFHEMRELGWIDKMPSLVAIQSSGCAPIVKAFEAHQEEVEEKLENADTIAVGLRVPKPYGSYLLLRALKETGGVAVDVEDEEIRSSMKILSTKGLDVCPEAAVALAGMQKMAKGKFFNSNDRILLYLTGNGMVYSHTTTTIDRTKIPLLKRGAKEID